MILMEDLIETKARNEQIIEENNLIIAEKQNLNCELKAENRVFDKLIAIEQSKQEHIEENV